MKIMENFIYTLLSLNYSQIGRYCVLRARVGGNPNVLSQTLCLGSTKKFKETKVYSRVNMPRYPNKQEQY